MLHLQKVFHAPAFSLFLLMESEKQLKKAQNQLIKN